MGFDHGFRDLDPLSGLSTLDCCPASARPARETLHFRRSGFVPMGEPKNLGRGARCIRFCRVASADDPSAHARSYILNGQYRRLHVLDLGRNTPICFTDQTVCMDSVQSCDGAGVGRIFAASLPLKRLHDNAR